MAVAPDELARGHELYARYYRGVYRYALSQLHSVEDAEDAAQNTFLRAFAALQKGVTPRNEATWIFRIARNVCASSKLAWLRRRRVETPRDLGLLPVEPVAPVAPRGELEGLADALAAMPPRLREAFLLREWQGLSYAEIAERLDTSRSAVETLIFRARRSLASELRRAHTLLLGPVGNWLRAAFGGDGGAVARGAGAAALAAGVVAGVATVPRAASTPPARTGPQQSVRAGAVPADPPARVAARASGPGAAATSRRQPATPRRPDDGTPAGTSPAGTETARAGQPSAPAPAAPPPAGAASGPTSSATVDAVGTVSATVPPEPAPLPEPLQPPSETATVPSETVTATVPSATVPAVTTPVATTPAVTTPASTVTVTLP